MHREEWEDWTVCIDCGQEIHPQIPSYPLAEESQLCLSCAMRRGAVYDTEHDRWLRAPSLRGISDRELEQR